MDNDFPILIKINSTDFFPDGTNINEAVKVARIFSDIGFNAIETSGGMWENVTIPEEELGLPPVFLPESRVNIETREQEAYFLETAKEIKANVKTPIMLVGGSRSFDLIEEILEKGSADFISLCRPLIRQPDLPNLWLSGKGPEKAACISCIACIPMGNNPIRCRANNR